MESVDIVVDKAVRLLGAKFDRSFNSLATRLNEDELFKFKGSRESFLRKYAHIMEMKLNAIENDEAYQLLDTEIQEKTITNGDIFPILEHTIPVKMQVIPGLKELDVELENTKTAKEEELKSIEMENMQTSARIKKIYSRLIKVNSDRHMYCWMGIFK